MNESDRTELVADGAMPVNEATKFSGMSRSFLYAEMEAGRLAYLKLGRARRIPRRALLKLMAGNVVGGDAN